MWGDPRIHYRRSLKMRNSRKLDDPSPPEPKERGFKRSRGLTVGTAGRCRIRGNPETHRRHAGGAKKRGDPRTHRWRSLKDARFEETR